MTDLKEYVIRKLQEKLPDLTETQVSEAAERAEEYFISVTKRSRVPEQARYLWIDLALKFLEGKETESGTASGAGMGGGKVSSIKRGDTTIEYSEGAAAAEGAVSLSDLEGRVLLYRVARSR